MRRLYALLLYGLAAVGIIAFDRITKLWALQALQYSEYNVTAWLSFDVVFNRGISWGLFHAESTHQFAFVTLVIAFITFCIAWHAYQQFQRHRCIIGHILIIAGSLSNSFDRIMYGGVIDFILLHYDEWSWPLFNVADISIVIGACLFLLLNLRDS
jgi:signal peptidase II